MGSRLNEINKIWDGLIEKLYQDINTKIDIADAIAYLGEKLDFQQIAVYIYQKETNSAYQITSWEEPGKRAETLFPEEYKSLDFDYRNILNEYGMLYYRENVAENEGIRKLILDVCEVKSVIKYGLMARNELFGCIMYEPVENSPVWTEEEMRPLSAISKLVCEHLRRGFTNKKLENQVNYLHTLYNKMFAAMVQIVEIDGKLEVVWANDAVFSIFGCDREVYRKLFHNSIERFVYVEDWENVRKYLAGLELNGEGTNFESRFINYYGEMRWLNVNAIRIRNQDGRDVIQVLFLDVTHNKKLQADLEHEKRRYSIALDSASDVIYEYDMVNDVFISYGSFTRDAVSKTTPIIIKDYKKRVIEGEEVYVDDIEQTLAFLSGEDGEPFEAREIYHQDGENKLIWIQTEGTLIYDNEVPIKMIGKKRNISEKKEKELKDLEVFKRDKLTKLYTKEVGENLIKQYLNTKQEEEIASLILIDLDNFQQINDTYGYIFGDAILEEIAEVIKSTTRQNDIIARYGGDEFLVLMKNTEKDKTTVYGKRLYEKICNLYAGEKEDIKISCSIGMVSTVMGETYEELFQLAEHTLASVKNNGKGDATCYCADEGEDAILPQKYFAVEKEKENDLIYSEKDNQDIVSFAFAILEKTKDLRSAINLLLARIGRHFNFEQISVIESDINYFSNIITYQWSVKEEYHTTISKYPMEKEEFELWMSYFEIDEILVMNKKIRKQFKEKDYNFSQYLKEDCSQLFSAILEEGEFKGTIVFEHADEDYIWTDEVCTILKEISKIISTHITKANADIASRAKTEFLSRMSHEIRTPMNAIVGMTNIAKNVIGDREKTMDCLEKIDSSTKYLLSLINDILDMSKIESGNMTLSEEIFDLDELIEELIVLIRPQAECKKIYLEIIKNYTDTVVIGDELRLNQVLINIMGNALKFTPEEGTITLSVEQLVQEEDLVKIRFSVRDTGIGIEENNLIRIFNSFEQAENNTAKRFGGTGLGLAISSNLVELMGGKLDVRSEEGKGSEFFFTISFARDMGNQEKIVMEKEVEETEEEQYDFKGKRLLVVEDNQLNAEIAQTILEMAGFFTELAEDGQQAVNAFMGKPHHYYDAILMDIRMPVMGGLEATRKIRTSQKEDSRSIPIIAMTANAFDEDTKKSIESGMNGHLSKPIDIQRLYQVLKENIKH